MVSAPAFEEGACGRKEYEFKDIPLAGSAQFDTASAKEMHLRLDSASSALRQDQAL